MTVTILANRRHTELFGLAGGKAGARGETVLRRVGGTTEKLGYAETTEVAAGDAIEVRSPGGGGFGQADDARQPGRAPNARGGARFHTSRQLAGDILGEANR
jgi:N-methylhydantoinase B/oxoprolinase/acetone carboxylase alpha subunit